MGLDNGILLRVRGRINENSPWYEKLRLNSDSVEEKNGFSVYDICYWRKCWNIREILFENCADTNGVDDCGSYTLTPEEIGAIRDALCDILRDGDAAWDDSIWTFEEAMNFLPWDIVVLGQLMDFLQENAGKCEVFFYDSY